MILCRMLTSGIGGAAEPKAPRRNATWLVSSRLISDAMACKEDASTSQRVPRLTPAGPVDLRGRGLSAARWSTLVATLRHSSAR